MGLQLQRFSMRRLSNLKRAQLIVDSKLHSMTSHLVMRAFTKSKLEKKLVRYAAGDFGWEEQRWNISYLSALGADLILRGHANIANFLIATTRVPYECEMGKNTDFYAFAMDFDAVRT